MFIHISKITTGPLTRSTVFGLQRLRCTVRRQYANEAHPHKPVNTGTLYTIGMFTSIVVGTVAYAKYDSDFREFLAENAPPVDDFIRFICQEKQTYGEQYDELVLSFKRWFSGSSSAESEKIASTCNVNKGYTPPRPAFTSLLDNEEKPPPYREIRVASDSGINTIQEKPKQVSGENSPRTIVELEARICDSAKHAVTTYSKACVAFNEYNLSAEKVIEDSVEKLGSEVWSALKDKADKKNALLKDAEDTAKDTIKDLERFRCLIDEKSFVASATAKATAKRNIDRVLTDIRKAKDDYDRSKALCNMTEKYWRLVFDARCHFIEELEILFPNFDINKKKLSLKPSDLDLFVVHAFKHVLYYQKEVQKLEVLTQIRLKQAIDAARRGDPDFDIKEVMIREEIDQEKRKLADDFHRKCLQQRQQSEHDLRHKLKCQEQAHIDHLADVLTVRETELERQFQRRLNETVMEEHSKYKLQMAGMVARMTGMRNAINERLEADKLAHQSQVLWSACQALYRSVKNAIPGVPYSQQIRPLQCEIDAIKLAAAGGDELVTAVLNAIPSEATKRGVFPEGALRERFIRVERAAKRLALVPAEGGRLPLYFLSFMQATLLSSASNPIPQDELDDKPRDFSTLNTYDILQRARYWIDRGNYTQTLKYMNLLTGASRCIANEWMNEARILLETQQAAETLMAHAVACGLVHL